MPRKIKGLYLRPDDVYEKIVTVKGKHTAFRSKDPDKVWEKYFEWKNGVERGATFEQVADKWEDEHLPTLTYSTMMGYMPAYRRVKNHFGKAYIKDITLQDIDAYIKRFAATRAFKTVTNELLVIRLILDYACINGHLNNNPAQFCKVPKGLPRKPREFPTDKEIQAVKDNVSAPFGLFMYFVLYTGCRRGEALAMQWRDIDFDSGEIHVKKSVYHKNNKPYIKAPKTEKGERVSVLLDRLREVLLPLKGKPDAYLFHNNGELLTASAVQDGLEQYDKAVGFHVRPHQLRHGYATMLFEAGIDMKTAQYLLGHAQMSTTMDVYTHFRKRQMLDAAKKLNSMDLDTSTQ